jgi:alkaline phosphatase D
MKLMLFPLLFFVLACAEQPSEKPITKIAFGSCAMQWEKQPIWNIVAGENPDLFIFCGDAIYGDWDGGKVFEVTEETLDRDYAKLAAIPEFKAFREKVPILATWDNHDYGSHNGGADFDKKEMTKTKFLDFFGEPEDSERWKTPGIYDVKIYGSEGKRVQIILIDTRSFKSPFKLDTLSKEERADIGKVGQYIPNEDQGATQIGAQQWAWLEEQLKEPAEIRLIVSSTQVIPNEKGMDEWGDFPKDRQRLLDLIASVEFGKTIILSGNVHFAELSKIENSGKEIFELTSSGLTHINESYGKAQNSFRTGQPFIDFNFGMVEIDWENDNLELIIIDIEGNRTVEHNLQF